MHSNAKLSGVHEIYSMPSQALDHIHIYSCTQTLHAAIHSRIKRVNNSAHVRPDRYDSVNVTVWDHPVWAQQWQIIWAVLCILYIEINPGESPIDNAIFGRNLFRLSYQMVPKCHQDEIANTRAENGDEGLVFGSVEYSQKLTLECEPPVVYTAQVYICNERLV